VIAANQDTVFARLCAVIGQPDLVNDERFVDHDARGAHEDELDAVIAAWAAEHDAADIDRLLNDAGVVCGPVYSIADIFEDAHFQARDMIVMHDDSELGPVAGPAVVPRFSRTPGAVRWSGPWQPGSHNSDVYCELVGLDKRELGELERAGVV
jgi:formyl-CoA transferase